MHLSLQALSTLPAAAYLLVERGILRGNTAVMGARWFKLQPPKVWTLWLTRSTVCGCSSCSVQKQSKLSRRIHTSRKPSRIALCLYGAANPSVALVQAVYQRGPLHSLLSFPSPPSFQIPPSSAISAVSGLATSVSYEVSNFQPPICNLYAQPSLS